MVSKIKSAKIVQKGLVANIDHTTLFPTSLLTYINSPTTLQCCLVPNIKKFKIMCVLFDTKIVGMKNQKLKKKT
jgi:hypothetical protein